MKIKIFIYAFLSLIVLTSCSFQKKPDISSHNTEITTSTSEFINSTTEDETNNEIKFSAGPFNENDIQQLFKLKREEVEKYLGTNYLIEFTGTEGGEMYRYENHDISIEYGPYDEVLQVYCGDKVSIYGTNSKMTFDEIKKTFVYAEIVEWSPDADPDIIFYRLVYESNNMLIMYISENKSGEDAWLRIIPVG